MICKKIFCLAIILSILHWDGLAQKISLEESESQVQFKLGSQTILSYQKSKAPVPEGVNPIFSKSGFIHPLTSPSGVVLTRIQPEDHYHHYGIWGPYTRASIAGREVDFWNLGDGKGRVEFAEVLSKKVAGGVAELNVRQHHFDLKAKESEQVAIREDLRIKVKPAGKERYMVDYTTTIFTDLPDGILLDDYRYGGGIGYRATEVWGSDNSQILTSEGDTRRTADGKNAKWILVSGESSHSSGKSGILFLSHNTNKSHPEPLRVWPENNYEGKGNVFVEFCPIRHESWQILPEQRYTLKYRMIVFDGDLTAAEADDYWKSFVK
ncbi:DUF6807 domain-containing protein [Algoriphagus namhaensis]